jgi:hypothetical protein
MKNKILIVTLYAVMIMMSGCATFQFINEPLPWKYAGFSFELPAGWVKCQTFGDLLMLTKDGQLLQQIKVFRYQTEKEKVLPATKKKFTKDMMPQEIAELIINELSFDQKHLNFSVSSNTPVDISGKQGFKLEYSFSTDDYLKYKAVMYGFKDENYIYIIMYQAATQHYFAKEISEFERFVSSLKFLS